MAEQERNLLKELFSKKIKKKVIVIIVIVLIFIIIAASCIHLDVLNGIFDDDDEYSPKKYSDNAYITENGTIMAGTAVQELWDNDDRYKKYLSSVDALAYLLNAELVTQYPYIESASNSELNGTVKFYRNNSKTPMKYVSSDTLYGYVSSYNSNGDAEAKNNALSCFTINGDGTIGIAYLKETINTVTTDDPAAAASAAEKLNTSSSSNNEGGYTIQTTESTLYTESIAYKNIIEKYTLPFELLWAIVVMGDDGSDRAGNSEDLAHAIASMAYDGEIRLIIDDNNQVTTTTDTYTYDQEKRTCYEDIYMIAIANNPIATEIPSSVERYNMNDYKTDAEKVKSHTTTYVKKDFVNSPSVKIDYIESWCAVYKNDAAFVKNNSAGSENLDSDQVTETDWEQVDQASKKSWEYVNAPSKMKEYFSSISQNLIAEMKLVNANESHEQRYSNIKKKTKIDKLSNSYTNGTVTSPSFNQDIADLFNVDPFAPVTRYITRTYYGYFMDIIEANTATSNMVDLINYIFNQVTETDDFGKDLQFESIWGSVNATMTSLTGLEAFREFIHYLEGTGHTSGDNYIVYADSGGVLTVGHGVTLVNDAQELRAHGIEPTTLSEGSQVPMDIVDSVELEVLQKGIEIVKQQVSQYNLADYQIFALVSRFYNHGNIDDFGPAYLQYWNEETDNKFGKTIPEGEKIIDDSQVDEYVNYYIGKVNNDLFSNWGMKWLTDEKGNKLGGLVRRRYDEWLLFQYGYFVNTGSCYSDSTSTSSVTTSSEAQAVIEKAESKLGCPYVWGAQGPNEFDCSGLVYWCYQQVGINVPRTTGEYSNKKYDKYKVSLEELQPGDILWRDVGGSGHAGIYIGNDTFIHAPRTGDVVKKASVTAYGKFMCAYRFWK